MVFNEFKDVIACLKRNYELRQLTNLNALERPAFIAKTKLLINALLVSFSPDSEKVDVTLPTHWTDTPLLINATHLIIYRECLGLVHQNKEEYDDKYVEFLIKHSSFLDAITRKNPFMLHEHLLHLGNIFQRYQDMQSGKVAPNSHIITNIETYKKMLISLQKQIDAMDHESFGTFKAYLKTLMCYTLYCASDNDVVDTYLKETLIQARIGSLCEACASKEDKALQQFYSCGLGLFARIRLKSFEAVEDYIFTLGSAPMQWQFYLDKAKQEFARLRDKPCDTNIQSSTLMRSSVL